jgi:TatD DNase family protein
MIDTHTHLYAAEFDNDQVETIERALEAGVKRFYLPAIDSTFTQKMYALEQQFPEYIFLMAGLHPTHVNENYKTELAHVKQQLSERTFVAIGEIGIDLYWDKTFLAQQQQAFREQIALAKHYKLPIVIHSRDSFDEIFEILEAEKSDDLYGIFHCFTGTYEQALRAIGLGFVLGIGGVATFKNGKIADYLAQIPIEHIVLETDSPYLAPVPHRGKRNESSYIRLIAEKVAEIYNLPFETIVQKTTENALLILQKNQ